MPCENLQVLLAATDVLTMNTVVEHLLPPVPRVLVPVLLRCSHVEERHLLHVTPVQVHG